MGFSLFKKKIRHFFTPEQEAGIVEAVRLAEMKTSGELRVFVESRCKYMDAVDRAAELFFELKMEETRDRNAVLLYLAMKDHQLAVFGDEGIHQRTGIEFWNKEVELMISRFNRDDYVAGITECIRDIGGALAYHFPYDEKADKNELPDNIVFGK